MRIKTAFSKIKPSRHAFIGIACVLSLIIGVAQVQAESIELRDARRTFEKNLRKFDRDFEKEHQTALVKYGEDLQKVLKFMQSKQDDFGTRPTEEEIKRFEAEQTVPVNIIEGTPKLIRQARDRYMSNTKPMRTDRERKRTALLDGYLSKLSSIEASLEASSKTADADAVRKELDRVHEEFGKGSGKSKKDEFSAIAAIPTISGSLKKGLALMYVMKARHAFRMRDLSGNRKHGQLIGASTNDKDPDALGFLKFHEILELDSPVELQKKWTMVIDAKFPLDNTDEEKNHVLITGAFRRDHIMVDALGTLGVGDNTFTESRYNINELEGWHRLIAIGAEGKTMFYLDGEKIGTARAQCLTPVVAIGNSPAYGQPWGSGLESVLIWNRVLTPEEIEKLPKKLVK